MTDHDTFRPSHAVRLEVDILTDEFAVPAPAPNMVLLVGVDAAVRNALMAVLTSYPGHVLIEAANMAAMLGQFVPDGSRLQRPYNDVQR